MSGRLIMSGIGWSAGATIVSAGCQLVFMGVLARLLDPATFGLMAMAAIALRFASFFAQLGFAQAIVQRPSLSPQDTTAALLMAAGIGTGSYVAMVLAAPLFAFAFQTQELALLIDVLAISLILSTVGSLPIALLRRHGRFKRVSGIEVFSFVFGYGLTGIACASYGLGVWSLVAATLSQQALIVVFGFAAARYPLEWPVPKAALKGLWDYGSRYSLIGFLEFLFANVETMYIGRLLGKAELGLFNRATTLTNLPVELGVTAVNKVLFPALSGMQHDRARLADGFQVLLMTIGLFSSGIACGIAAAAPDLVGVLLGAKWQEGVSPIVAVLAFAVPPMFMYVACGITFDSMAALTVKLRAQSVMLIVKVAAVVLLAHWGLTGLAAAVVIGELLRLLLGVYLVGRLLDIPLSRLACQIGLVALTGATVSISVSGCVALAHWAGLPLLGRVALEATGGALGLVTALFVLVVAFPNYAPLQRFETLRTWHARVLAILHVPTYNL